MARQYDVIVYGASGFTGKHVALEVSKSFKVEGKTWAVAGRSEKKLKKVLEDLNAELGEDLNDIGIITADVNDQDSLIQCCQKGRILLNCVGPFLLYGEQVVSACVAAKTHYVDVSGEPEFLESMQLKYTKEAEEAGIHIVGACGFDSIPADCGLEFLKSKFDGTLTSAESYLKYHGRLKGNIGTYESLVNGLGSSGNLRAMRKKLMPEKLNYAGEKLKKRGTMFYSKTEKQWAFLFMGADPSVVRRTQYHKHLKESALPIQYGAYICMNNILEVMVSMLFGLFLAILSPFKWGRELLIKYPRFFSLGCFSPTGLTKKELSERSFSMVMYGYGYSQESQLSGPQDRALGLRINGPEPGYVATPIFLVQAAYTILDDDLPNKGGVYTPGVAFNNTSLIERLIKSGIEFSTFPVDVRSM